MRAQVYYKAYYDGKHAKVDLPVGQKVLFLNVHMHLPTGRKLS